MRNFVLMLMLLYVAGCSTQTGYSESRPMELNATNSVIFIEADVMAKRSNANKQSSDQETPFNVPVSISSMDMITDKVKKGAELIDLLDPDKEVPPVIVVPPEDKPPIVIVPPDTTDEIGSYSCKEYTRSEEAKGACRTATNFNKVEGPIRFEFDNGCGGFAIPDASVDFLEFGKEGYAYLEWEKGSPVVFSEAGCVASKVTAYKDD